MGWWKLGWDGWFGCLGRSEPKSDNFILRHSGFRVPLRGPGMTDLK
jgi:hypothetical protein